MNQSPEAFIQQKLNQAHIKGGILTETVILTPALARELLKHNPDNRKIKSHKLSTYVRDIKEGRWVHNSQTISVAKTNELNNGQHRCHAVIEANMAITVEMSFGEERDARFTHDLGASRTAGDILGFSKYVNPIHLASITKLIISYEGTLSKPDFERGFTRHMIGVPEIAERIKAKDFDLINEAAAFANNHAKAFKDRMVPSVAGFCYWLLCSANHAAGKVFMETLSAQDGTSSKDPEWHLYRTLLTRSKLKAPKVELVEAVVRAYNLRRQGKSTQKSSQVRGFIPAARR